MKRAEKFRVVDVLRSDGNNLNTQSPAAFYAESARATIDWRSTIPSAREKLKKLDPVGEE